MSVKTAKTSRGASSATHARSASPAAPPTPPLAAAAWTSAAMRGSVTLPAPVSAAPPSAVLSPALAGPPPGMARILRPEAAQRWMGWRVKDYTPTLIESILRDAMTGEPSAQWELFHLMEDTWPRLAKALREIKQAVQQMDWRVEPWAEDGAPPTEEAKRRARLASHALWTMRPDPTDGANDFPGTVFDLLDAWGKGVSVVEVLWEIRPTRADGDLWVPAATYWVDPRQYGWNQGRLELRSEDSRSYMPFPPHRFAVGICKSKSGPLGAVALLRPLAWWWAASNFSAAWLLNLAQVFGLPIRWAQYPTGAAQHTIDQVCAMLENMGSSAWGAFPAGTSIELKEATKGTGSWPQEGLLDRADKQVDLLILGQTLTTDVGDSGSRALGGVHMTVLDSIKQSAADWVAGVVNQQLVGAFLEINWGNRDEAPEFCPRPADRVDLAAEATRLLALQQAGMQIPRAWAHERQQVPMPQPGEEVLEAPAPAGMSGLPPFARDAGADPAQGDAPLDPQEADDEEDDNEDDDPAAAAPMETARALGATSAPLADVTDRIAASRASALAEAFRGSLAPIRKLVEDSTSAEDLTAKIRAYYADWSPGRAATVAAEALEIAAAAGAKAGMPVRAERISR